MMIVCWKEKVVGGFVGCCVVMILMLGRKMY